MYSILVVYRSTLRTYPLHRETAPMDGAYVVYMLTQLVLSLELCTYMLPGRGATL
jgi:hypothetical protein